MHTITAVADLPADPELQALLAPYIAAMDEFGEDLSIVILIVAAGDTLAQAEEAYGGQLVADSQFTFVAEMAREHIEYIEVVAVMSDDGAGLVLLVEKGGDAELMTACRAALAIT